MAALVAPRSSEPSEGETPSRGERAGAIVRGMIKSVVGRRLVEVDVG